MKKIQIASLTLLVALVFFQGVANAKTISGKIAGINTAASKLSIGYTDLATGKEEKVDVTIKPETTYSGVAVFADLKEGQAVLVDAIEGVGTEGLSAASINTSTVEPKAETVAEGPLSPILPATEKTEEHKM